MIDVDTSAERCQFVVQGNRSMSWRANLWLAASLGLIVGGIALVMAAHGLWLVVPFAGLEILFVVVCLYLTLRRMSRREVITVEEQAIRLEWGYTRPVQQVELPRQWSRLNYVCADSPFDCGELSVAAHGKTYALGQCLNKQEKKSLYGQLQAALRGVPTAA
jgi:uncharacterized membrane protein